MQDLLNGYLKFRNDISLEKLSELHLGQNPKALIIACCDSRVDPALLFQCDPGDLFVIRNIANIVPPYAQNSFHHETSSALEFGIKVLKISNVIILGHSLCGGIKAWIELKQSKTANNSLMFVHNWIAHIDVRDYEKYSADDCARFSLVNSYNNCLTFHWIRDRLATRELNIHLWFFDIETCTISTYDHVEGMYKKILSVKDIIGK